ncbi:phosphate ABC transporter substrate-binding protein PstS [Acidipila sp. EB88]|nr:phosphate ABC transporter substrate-binding protein PstS [Acidipila sp. EB88]
MLSGAGSTFVYPVMTRWIEQYSQAHTGTQINYQSIGSGGGIEQVKNKTVDFGASDAALTDAQLQTMPAVVQIPESAGPVCLTYNLPGFTGTLQLSPATLAGMFLGTIKTWSDPAVAKDNPGARLPGLPVVIVHRADGSGTTAIFTDYLAAVSPVWKSKVGAGKSVSWPLGLGGKGSEGVTGQLRQSPGAIGYVELTYAEQNKLPEIKVENAAGAFVAPTAAGSTAAINAFATQLAQDPRASIVNPPASAKDAYPISGLTFLILPKDGPDKTRRTALKGFVRYIISDGQTVAGSLNYAPLPDNMKQYDAAQLKLLTAAGQPLP